MGVKIILKFNEMFTQTVGETSKISGLVKAKHMVPVINSLNLEANPRSACTGRVTEAIHETIESVPELLPFKTKGILLAASDYEELDRSRICMTINDITLEGILDGGHSTLAIGLYILEKSLEHAGKQLPRGQKKWDEFKELWNMYRTEIEQYLTYLRGATDPEGQALDFMVPVELLVPSHPEDPISVGEFRQNLFEICVARNNNVELQANAKANQQGYFDSLKSLMEKKNPDLYDRISWRYGDGGDIKVENLIALLWIPLSLLDPVHDIEGNVVQPVSAQKVYSGKGSCLEQFERFMSSPEVSYSPSVSFRSELKNNGVISAFRIAVELPELYDYIYENFPRLYNNAGGSFGRINAARAMNEKRKTKKAPFSNMTIETLIPDGFVVPLVYGLQALIKKETDGVDQTLAWKCDPRKFLEDNLLKIMRRYINIISLCGYDPQKVGKAIQSYSQALDAYNMAFAGII